MPDVDPLFDPLTHLYAAALYAKRNDQQRVVARVVEVHAAGLDVTGASQRAAAVAKDLLGSEFPTAEGWCCHGWRLFRVTEAQIAEVYEGRYDATAAVSPG